MNWYLFFAAWFFLMLLVFCIMEVSSRADGDDDGGNP